MTPRECLLLIPGYGLDDFPKSLPSSQADDLLGGWIALWHPKLIAGSRAAPRWQRADQPPHELQNLLIVVPCVCKEKLPSDFQATIARAGGCLVHAKAGWREFQSEILEALVSINPEAESGSEHPARPAGCTQQVESTNSNASCASWLDDFAALGYAYLQIQLMTRQLRYTSNLDQLLFDDQLTQAAVAVLEGDAGKAELMLQSCFDSLGQERDHYYSSEVSLIDVTLLASSTLGPALARQFDRNVSTTLVASAGILQQMAQHHSDNFARVRQDLTENKISVAGGLDVERPHPLMTLDAAIRDLHRGRVAYERLSVSPPTVFTRFSFGALPDMPLHLRRSGFTGALLVPWESGSYPKGSQAKFSWEASEGTFVSGLTPAIVDANDPASYLSLGVPVGESLDHQNVPTLIFAHWPDRYASYFDLLVRISRRTPALGRFTHAQEYFDKTDQPYHQERLAANQFRHDWLGNSNGATRTSLLTAVAEYHRISVTCRSLLNLANLSYQIDSLMTSARSKSVAATPSESDKGSPLTSVSVATTTGQARPLGQWNPELAELLDRVDAMLDQPQLVESSVENIAKKIDALAHSLTCKIAKSVGYRVLDPAQISSESTAKTSKLVFNPCSNPLRIPLKSDKEHLPPSDASWCYVTGRVGEHRISMVDVPAFGLIESKFERRTENAIRKERPLAEVDGLMFNDFLEIQIDARTGNLRSLHVPARRGNRLSLQIARRESDSAKSAQYSEVRAGEIRLLGSSNVFGLIRASGELWIQGKKTGTFEIDYELMRGSRVLEVTVRLDALADLRSDPWQSAYILRTAWPNESAILTHYQCGGKHTWSRGQAISPLLIEIDETDYRTHLLTAGLAFHRRVDDRFLESLLAIQGTKQIERRIGIGVDLPYPQQSAEQFLDRQYVVDVEPLTKTVTNAQWFMHVNAKSVRMQLDSPLVDNAGRDCGIRVHLTETSGKSATTRVRCLREVREAHRVDYLGQELGKVTADGDNVSIVLRPNEMIFVDIYWKS